MDTGTTISPRYKKTGNVVFGSPFKDGSYGIRVVKDYVRVFHLEPIIRMRKLSAREKARLVS